MSRFAGENARQLHLHVCVCDTPAFLVSITLSVRCAVHLGEPPCVYGARCSLWQRGSHWNGAELADRYSFDVGAGVGHWLAAVWLWIFLSYSACHVLVSLRACARAIVLWMLDLGQASQARWVSGTLRFFSACGSP